MGELCAEIERDRFYAGQAPDLVSGIAQFTVVVPDNATGVLPLTLVVGGVFSPGGVTIAVK